MIKPFTDAYKSIQCPQSALRIHPERRDPTAQSPLYMQQLYLYFLTAPNKGLMPLPSQSHGLSRPNFTYNLPRPEFQ